MAMAQNPEPVKTDGPAAMFGMMTAPMETLWPNQHRLLTIWGDFASHWMERRQRAAQTAIEAAQQMLASSSQPARQAEIAGAWFRGSLERIAADMQEYQACCGEAAAMMQAGSQQTLTGLGEGRHGKGRQHAAQQLAKK